MGRPKLSRTKVCPRCGVEFTPKDWRSVFCSRRCSKLKDLPTKTCERCGQGFRKNPEYSYAVWEAIRFCSYKCRGGPEPKERFCARCGAEYSTGHGNRSKYCSQDCYWEGLRTELYPVRNRRRGREFSHRMKRLLLERANYRCERCSATDHLEYDHIVPCHAGGMNDLANGQVLCRECHRDKTRDDAPENPY